MAFSISRAFPSLTPFWPTSPAQHCWPGCPLCSALSIRHVVTLLPSSTLSSPVLPPLLPDPTPSGDPHPGQLAETPDSCLIYLFVSPAKKRMLREPKPANYTPSHPHNHVFYYHHPPCFLLLPLPSSVSPSQLSLA